MREEKRWLRLENGLSHFSLLAAKFICAPGVIKAEQNDTLTKDKIPRWSLKISVNPYSILQPLWAK